MADRELLIQQTVERLKKLQTVEDVRNAKDEIADIIGQIVESALEILGSFLENMFSMDPEKVQEEARQYQDESFLFPPEIGKEMERFESMSGGDEFGEEMETAMKKRLEPCLEEYAEKMGKMMENLMGGLMGGLADAFGGSSDVEDEEEAEQFTFDSDNPDTPEILYQLYAARTLADLKENKDWLIETLEEQLQSDIWDLELFIQEEFEGDKEKAEKIQYRMKRIEPEIKKEFTRLAALPDSAKEAEAIKKELLAKVKPKLKLLKAIKKKDAN